MEEAEKVSIAENPSHPAAAGDQSSYADHSKTFYTSVSILFCSSIPSSIHTDIINSSVSYCLLRTLSDSDSLKVVTVFNPPKYNLRFHPICFPHTIRKEIDRKMSFFLLFGCNTGEMKILSWNVQGYGNKDTRNYMKDIIKSNDPDIIFLCETTIKKNGKTTIEFP